MEKDIMWTFPNRNGRTYKVDKMIETIKEWAQSNGAWIDPTIKDINAFYRNKKESNNTKRLEQFVIDPQSMFIDYIDLMRP